MAAGNTKSASRPGDLLALLAPLAAAHPGAPSGRVRSLEEARRALAIPTSPAKDVLMAWGTPTDFQLTVYPVGEANEPDLVAEFAVLRVIKRKDNTLVTGTKHTRLHLREKSNALWIVFGSIVVATDGKLVLEQLAIGPAFAGQLSRVGDDAAYGITAPLLRLLSPPRLLAACVEKLQAAAYRLEQAAQQGDSPPLSDRHRQLLARLNEGRPDHAPTTTDQLAELAKRYITLVTRGLTRPLPQLAREFGLTPQQARDRIYKARKLGYLGPATPGKANHTLGPRLKRLNWNPPYPHPDHKQVEHPMPVARLDNGDAKRSKPRRPRKAK